MSEPVLIAAFVVLAGAIGTVAKLLWDHVAHCRSVQATLAEIAGDVKRIKEEVGDREGGMRKLLHEHSGYHFENDGRFQRIEERLELPHWKRRRT